MKSFLFCFFSVFQSIFTWNIRGLLYGNTAMSSCMLYFPSANISPHFFRHETIQPAALLKPTNIPLNTFTPPPIPLLLYWTSCYGHPIPPSFTALPLPVPYTSMRSLCCNQPISASIPSLTAMCKNLLIYFHLVAFL